MKSFIKGEWVLGTRGDVEEDGMVRSNTTTTVLKDPNTDEPKKPLPLGADGSDDHHDGSLWWKRHFDEEDNRFFSDGNFNWCTVLSACSDEQVDIAVQHAAHDTTWHAVTTIEERYEILLEAIDRGLCKDSMLDLMGHVDAVETGIHRDFTRMIAEGLQHAARAFTKKAFKFFQEHRKAPIKGAHGHDIVPCTMPVSPVVIIAPWNAPCGTIIPKVFVALLAGCNILIKPSEHAPSCIALMAKLLLESGKDGGVGRGDDETKKWIPPSALQVIQGGPDVGKALVNHPKVAAVQFTGATATASHIAIACAEKLRPFQAECGGSNAAVVFNDADLEHAASHILDGVTMLNGQWCMGVTRVLVHEDVEQRLVSTLVSKFLEKVVIQNSTDPPPPLTGSGDSSSSDQTLVGPLAFEDVANHLREMVQNVLGGQAIELGQVRVKKSHKKDELLPPAFFIPTMVLRPDPEAISSKELFGPAFGIIPFKTDADAIRIANLASGQLATYLFSKDVEKMYAIGIKFHTGMIMVNGIGFSFEVADGEPEPASDFVGSAGYGSDGNGEALAVFFSSQRWCGVNGAAKSGGTAPTTAVPPSE